MFLMIFSFRRRQVFKMKHLSGSYCNIHVANNACTGGSMVLSPYARADGGFLEVIFINTTRKRDIIRIMRDYIKGHFEKYDIFFQRKCRKIEIKSNALMSVQMDGEAFHASELTLEIIPKGIKFFAPKDLEIADYSNRAYKNSGKDKKSNEKSS